jgi:hypothetical protein
VQLRVAPPDGGPRLNATRRTPVQRCRSILILIVALTACGLAAACHRPARARTLSFDWTLTPRPPAVGPVVLTLRIRDGAGRAVHGARLRVEAQMAHPGMATVLAPATERPDGAYEAGFRLTMGGDWILLIAGALASGEVVEYRIDVPNVRSSGGSTDVPS